MVIFPFVDVYFNFHKITPIIWLTEQIFLQTAACTHYIHAHQQQYHHYSGARGQLPWVENLLGRILGGAKAPPPPCPRTAQVHWKDSFDSCLCGEAFRPCWAQCSPWPSSGRLRAPQGLLLLPGNGRAALFFLPLAQRSISNCYSTDFQTHNLSCPRV